MNPRLSLLAIAGLVLPACGSNINKSTLKILGGTKTNENSAVVRITSDSGACTGTFIRKNVILTAAHCNHMGYNGRAPSKDIVHPRYSAEADSDLAGAQFDLRILIFNESLSESTVNISTNPPKAGEMTRAIGFGVSDFRPDEGISEGSGVKRAGNIKIDIVEDQYIAAINSDVNVCFGDSGGPLLNRRGEIVGVASRIGTENSAVQSFWTNIDFEENRQFISESLSQGNESQDPASPNNSNQNNGNPSTQPERPDNQGNLPALIDCVRDYAKVRSGVNGVCINRSSGYCYRYGGGDVLYDQGRVSCSSHPGSPGSGQNGSSSGQGGSQPQTSSSLDCNNDYLEIIRSKSEGICLNRSSGFCYRYSNGDIRYNDGQVACR